MAITVFQLAKFRGIKEDSEGSISMGAFQEVKLPFMGGCKSCEASIAAYNAYPTKCGYLSCSDCLSPEEGYETVQEANISIFPQEYNWLGAGEVAVQTEYDSTDYSEDYEPSDELQEIAAEDE